jgi:hypothetical protein
LPVGGRVLQTDGPKSYAFPFVLATLLMGGRVVSQGTGRTPERNSEYFVIIFARIQLDILWNTSILYIVTAEVDRIYVVRGR